MDNATETYVTGRTNAVNHKHQMVYYLRLSYKQMMLYLKKKKAKQSSISDLGTHPLVSLSKYFQFLFSASWVEPGPSGKGGSP